MRWRRPRLRMRSLMMLVALLAVLCWGGLILISPARWLERRLQPGAPAYARKEAAGMLGESWVVPPWETNRAVSALIRTLDDPDPMVRQQAVMGLERRGRAAVRALPMLVDRLGDESGSVRSTTALVLAILAPMAADRASRVQVEEALIEALDDPDPYVRLFASQSLMDLGREEEAAPGFAGALAGSNEQVRDWAAYDLRKRGAMPPGVVLALVDGLEARGPDAPGAVVSALLSYFSADALRLALLPAAAGPGAERRAASRTLLGRIEAESPAETPATR